jgi:hypothetical protein
VAGDSERSIRAPLPARTSPAWLTHLVAFLLGAAVTFVIKDLRTGATPDVASDPKAPATALDRTQSAAAEALPEGDAETEPSDDPPDEAQPNPASSSAWQWPTPDPNAAEPETSASPLPSAAPEPSSASSAAEAGSFDAVAARSALGGLAVSAAGCGDGTTKGKARVAVTFANSGKATVALIQGGPLSGTGVGSCIANILRSAQVPAYSGPITTVFTTVVVQ